MKVLIADPQPTVRHALSIWISGQPGWDVVGEAGDSSDLLEKLDQLSPEVVILDRDLPGTPVGELVKRLRQVPAELVIILLTSSPLEHFPAEALDVNYCASKIDPPHRILDAIINAKSKLENKLSPTNGQGFTKVDEPPPL